MALTKEKSNISIVLLAILAILTQTVLGKPKGNGRDDRNTDPSLISMRGFTEGDTGTTDWFATGEMELQKQIADSYNFGEAKNVIFVVGDGMGMTTLTASRIYKAQARQLMGDDVKLEFEKWAHTGLSITYNTDTMTSDSAGTATAMLCGEKAKRRHVGVSQHVPVGNCTAQNLPGMKLKSILKHAIDAGKSTGFITTDRVTQATPGSAYAHSSHREWESDGEQAVHDEFPLNDEERQLCPDIAKQLIENEYAKNIRVILGGGRKMFLPNTTQDPEYEEEYGTRLDNRNLIEEWVQQKLDTGYSSDQVKYVDDQAKFDDVNPENTEFLFGMFEPDEMHYNFDRTNTSLNRWPEPSLSEMVEKSIQILRKNENGYFLLIEGAKMDKAHHANLMMKALDETMLLSDAVQVAREITSPEDTLIVVTADHSHPMYINGDPVINTDVLGISSTGKDDNGEWIFEESMLDGKPHMVLGYGNGPGYIHHRGTPPLDGARKDLTDDYTNGLIGKPDFLYDAAMYRDSDTHGGEDVTMYAHGPMSHLFQGLHEQHYIAHAMMYASCVGPNQAHCQGAHYPMQCQHSSSTDITQITPWLMIILIVSSIFIS